MFQTKSRIMILGALALLALIGVGLGWGAHAIADKAGLQGDVTPSPQTTATPTATSTVTATLTLPLPTVTPAPQQQIIVQSGESLYAVCRRYCPQNWGPGVLDDALRHYATQVATLNALPWNEAINGYAIHPGNVLNMPPCPAR